MCVSACICVCVCVGVCLHVCVHVGVCESVECGGEWKSVASVQNPQTTRFPFRSLEVHLFSSVQELVCETVTRLRLSGRKRLTTMLCARSHFQ